MRVVITGASSGIGEALARYYAAPGNVLGLDLATRSATCRTCPAPSSPIRSM